MAAAALDVHSRALVKRARPTPGQLGQSHSEPFLSLPPVGPGHTRTPSAASHYATGVLAQYAAAAPREREEDTSPSGAGHSSTQGASPNWSRNAAAASGADPYRSIGRGLGLTAARKHPAKPIYTLPRRLERQLSENELREWKEMHRDIIRRELISKAGSAREAFRRLDNNNSGRISLQDFADGVTRLGVNWQEITGFRKPLDLFRLFDLGKDMVVDFTELFPQDNEHDMSPHHRLSTPEFWQRWCRRNKDLHDDQTATGGFDRNKLRCAHWQPSTSEEELRLLFDEVANREEVAEKRRWMSGTMRRLKNKGKSDARCREVVALHLPRGSGPKDREDVQTFSEAEVKACKKVYLDQVQEPVKNIQKVVADMHDQRKELQHTRQKLWTLTMEPIMRQKAEEERKNAVTSLMTGDRALLDKVKAEATAAHAAPSPESPSADGAKDTALASCPRKASSTSSDVRPRKPSFSTSKCSRCGGKCSDISPVADKTSSTLSCVSGFCPVCSKQPRAPHHVEFSEE